MMHRNQGGSASDIGPLNENVQRLLDAGIQPFVTVIGEAGHAAELADMGALVAFAIDSWRFAPSYATGTAGSEGRARWDYIKARIPPEIAARRDKIWLIAINEPDENYAAYVHNFMLGFAAVANADGYRVCGPNWSAGTCRIHSWEHPAALAWLRYCADNPTMAALAIHEYSLDENDIRFGFPYLMGRHQFILDICEAHGIARPPILVCEAGWGYDDIPDTDEAIRQLTEPDGDEPSIMELYDGVPFALWTIGGWNRAPDLPAKVARLIMPLTDWMLAQVEPPPPPDYRLELIEESERRQAETGIVYDPGYAYIRWMVGDNPEPAHYAPAHSEGSFVTSDGVAWALQGAIDLKGVAERVTLAYRKPWTSMRDVLFLRRSDLEPEPEPAPQMLFSAPVGTPEQRERGELWQ